MPQWTADQELTFAVADLARFVSSVAKEGDEPRGSKEVLVDCVQYFAGNCCGEHCVGAELDTLLATKRNRVAAAFSLSFAVTTIGNIALRRHSNGKELDIAVCMLKPPSSLPDDFIPALVLHCMNCVCPDFPKELCELIVQSVECVLRNRTSHLSNPRWAVLRAVLVSMCAKEFVEEFILLPAPVDESSVIALAAQRDRSRGFPPKAVVEECMNVGSPKIVSRPVTPDLLVGELLQSDAMYVWCTQGADDIVSFWLSSGSM